MENDQLLLQKSKLNQDMTIGQVSRRMMILNEISCSKQLLGNKNKIETKLS